MASTAGSVDESKVRARVAGRRAAEEFLTLALEESSEISKRHGIDGGIAFLLSLTEQLQQIIPADREAAVAQPEEAAWLSAVKLCDEIIADCAKVGPGGEEFAASVTSTTESIRCGVMRSKRVSLAQQDALQNMHAGVLRWLA